MYYQFTDIPGWSQLTFPRAYAVVFQSLLTHGLTPALQKPHQGVLLLTAIYHGSECRTANSFTLALLHGVS